MHAEKIKKSKEAGEFEYMDFISLANLFQAWNQFKVGKRKKSDVMLFERYLETNLFDLHLALKNKTYKHGSYKSFYVQDPKLRHIHKATVADRVVHHLLYQYLYEVFDKTFIYDSYSCRLEKGTHKGILRLKQFTRKVSQNYTRACWVLKCDIKKFFANVDQEILMGLLSKKIKDKNILWLLSEVITSFHSESGDHKGIPLGNLTSQVFANIYMDKLDQFVKEKLKAKYYIRYADDFLFLSRSKGNLYRHIEPLATFLKKKLELELHPQKIILRRLEWGIGFLGYTVLPHHILPKTKTKKRVFQKLKIKINDQNFNQSLQSYLGYLSHASSFKLTQKLKNQIWLWRSGDL